MSMSTCIAPVNIAVIKYWGKRDEELILPLNDSISATLCTDQMHAKTTVMASPKFIEDKIWLNGKEESFENPRLARCLEEIRKKAGKNTPEGKANWKVHVCSENNFPTAAGLASSAAGYACLVYCLGRVFGIDGNLSAIARMGSGSACRSMYGGFVRWTKGEKSDGTDSQALQVVPSSHWPEMRILILVVNDDRKKVSSTSGMKRSVETSELLEHRIKYVVPKRTQEIIQAIKEKDFNTFAELTMKDSNQFHSVCMDTFPPAVYINDISHLIIDFVHSFNKMKNSIKIAYTFDAGPNACLFLKEEDVSEAVSLLKQTFPPKNNKEFVRGLPFNDSKPDKDIKLATGLQEIGLLKYIIHTKVGEGPQVLKGNEHHLLNSEGFPINLK